MQAGIEPWADEVAEKGLYEALLAHLRQQGSLSAASAHLSCGKSWFAVHKQFKRIVKKGFARFESTAEHPQGKIVLTTTGTATGVS